MTETFLLHAVGAKWEKYKIRVQALSFFFKRLRSVLEFCQRFGCFSVSRFHSADEAGMRCRAKTLVASFEALLSVWLRQGKSHRNAKLSRMKLRKTETWLHIFVDLEIDVTFDNSFSLVLSSWAFHLYTLCVCVCVWVESRTISYSASEEKWHSCWLSTLLFKKKKKKYCWTHCSPSEGEMIH